MLSNHVDIIDAVLTKVYGTAPDHLPSDDGIEFVMSCGDLPELKKIADSYLSKALPSDVVARLTIRFEDLTDLQRTRHASL